jgi:hypothetical protein
MAVIGATQLEPVNILGSYVQGLEMGRANRLAQQQQAEAAESARVQREMRNALAGGLDVTTPEGQAKLMQFGAPGLEMAAQGAKIGAERARGAEAETSRQKTLLDIDTAKRAEARTKLDEALKLVTAASRQTYPQIYRQAVEKYGQEEINKLGLTPEYDEKLLGSLGQSMISAKDRIDQQLRAREARAAEGRLYVDQTRAQLEQRRVDIEGQRLALEERKASPDYQEIKLDTKTRAKREEAFPKASAAYRTAVNDIDTLINQLETLKTMPGLKAITGGVEGRTPSFFKEATAAQAQLDKILAKGQFRSLQALRDASPTGGAVGNVSDAEGKALRDSFGAFNQAQQDEDFVGQIDDTIADLRFSKQNITQAFDDEYAYRSKGKPSTTPQGGRNVRSEADAILGIK